MWIYVWVQSSGRPSPNSQIRTSSNIALLNVPLQPKALSAPVTTCAPAKPCTTCSCSNILVIDGQQVQLSMPMAAVWRLRQLRHPLSPQAGVKIADRVYFGGSPTRESSVELFDHIYHNITPVFPFVGINKDNIPWLLLLTYFQKSSRTHLSVQVLSFLNLRDKAESLKYSLWPRSGTLSFFLFRIKSHRVKLNIYLTYYQMLFNF